MKNQIIDYAPVIDFSRSLTKISLGGKSVANQIDWGEYNWFSCRPKASPSFCMEAMFFDETFSCELKSFSLRKIFVE